MEGNEVETEQTTGAEFAEYSAPDDPLADFRPNGGITIGEFNGADRVRLGDGSEVSSLALAAAGTHTTDGRELAQGEREMHARRIDDAARSYAAWLDSRPLLEQIRGTLAPVIFVPPFEGE